MSFTRRIHPATGIAAVFGAWLSLTASVAAHERIVEWVDFAPVTDANRIALGYPVPVPVDTPLPFAGFRSSTERTCVISGSATTMQPSARTFSVWYPATSSPTEHAGAIPGL